MKRFLSIILCILMMATLPISTLATSVDDPSKSVALNDFGITETVDEYDRVIRTYERDEVVNTQTLLGNIDYTETKNILLALGMEQDFIDKLSLEALERYRTSTKLVGITSYTKTNIDGNVEYIEEEIALEEAALINAVHEERMRQLASGDKSIQTRDQITYQDSYMRVFYLVTYEGSAEYNFSTDARWLTMPLFRGKDSIGSCAYEATVEYDTRSGWYEYDIDYIYLGVITSDYYTDDISESNFKEAINGNWYGSAGIVTLPSDIYSGYTSIVYTNYKAHYEYNGHVTDPDDSSYFNTAGTYSHSKIAILFTPTVSIGISGAEVSIEINASQKDEPRTAKLEIHYVP